MPRYLLVAALLTLLSLASAYAADTTLVVGSHRSAVRGVNVSGNDSLAITWGLDSVAQVWELATGRRVALLRTWEGVINSAFLSADGKEAMTFTVATHSGSLRVRRWDVRNARAIDSTFLEFIPTRMRRSADGTSVILVGERTQVIPFAGWNPKSDPVGSPFVDADVAIGTGRVIHVANVDIYEQGSQIPSFFGLESVVRSIDLQTVLARDTITRFRTTPGPRIAVHPDGNLVVINPLVMIAADPSAMSVFDLSKRTVILNLNHLGASSFYFDRYERLVILDSGRVFAYDVTLGWPNILDTISGDITAVDFGLDGRLRVVGRRDGSVTLQGELPTILEPALETVADVLDLGDIPMGTWRDTVIRRAFRNRATEPLVLTTTYFGDGELWSPGATLPQPQYTLPPSDSIDLLLRVQPSDLGERRSVIQLGVQFPPPSKRGLELDSIVVRYRGTARDPWEMPTDTLYEIPTPPWSSTFTHFLPNGLLLSGSGNVLADGRVRTWSPETGRIVWQQDGRGQALSVDSSIVIVAQNATTFSVDALSGDSIAISRGNAGESPSVFGNLQLRRIGSVLQVENRLTGATVTTLPEHGTGVNLATFSPGGRWAASSAPNDSVFVYDPSTWERVAAIDIPGTCNSCRFLFTADESKIIVLGTESSPPFVIDLATMSRTTDLTGVEGRNVPMGLARSVDRVVMAGDQGSVSVWKIGTGAKLFTSPAFTGRVAAAAISPNGQLVAGLDTTGLVIVWDVASGEERARHQFRPTSTIGAVYTIHPANLSYSPDGTFLVATARDGVTGIFGPTVARPVAAVEPSNVPLSSIVPGTSVPITVRNRSLAAIELEPRIFGDPAFSLVSSSRLTIPAGGEATIHVLYQPDRAKRGEGRIWRGAEPGAVLGLYLDGIAPVTSVVFGSGSTSSAPRVQTGDEMDLSEVRPMR